MVLYHSLHNHDMSKLPCLRSNVGLAMSQVIAAESGKPPSSDGTVTTREKQESKEFMKTNF